MQVLIEEDVNSIRPSINRDRGKPFGFSPPTSPCVRVRTRRFGWLSGRGDRKEWSEAESLEVPRGQSLVKCRAFGQTPGAVAGAHRLRGEITRHAQATKFREATATGVPVFPHHSPKATVEPGVQVA